jgi:hypothetical protein
MYWSTEDELRYLKRLGHHLTIGSGRETDDQTLSREELLERYKYSMFYRANWGQMDPGVILLHVNAELVKARKEVPRG